MFGQVNNAVTTVTLDVLKEKLSAQTMSFYELSYCDDDLLKGTEISSLTIELDDGKRYIKTPRIGFSHDRDYLRVKGSPNKRYRKPNVSVTLDGITVIDTNGNILADEDVAKYIAQEKQLVC